MDSDPYTEGYVDGCTDGLLSPDVAALDAAHERGRRHGYTDGYLAAVKDIATWLVRDLGACAEPFCEAVQSARATRG